MKSVLTPKHQEINIKHKLRNEKCHSICNVVLINLKPHVCKYRWSLWTVHSDLCQKLWIIIQWCTLWMQHSLTSCDRFLSTLMPSGVYSSNTQIKVNLFTRKCALLSHTLKWDSHRGRHKAAALGDFTFIDTQTSWVWSPNCLLILFLFFSTN